MECICGVLGEATALPVHLLRRLLAIEEQAKRVVRAEMWLKWARASAHAETDEDAWHGAIVSAADALRAERRKLAEMVGEGDET